MESHAQPSNSRDYSGTVSDAGGITTPFALVNISNNMGHDVAARLGRAIETADTVTDTYAAGCMNLTVAVCELSIEEFDVEPQVIVLERPFKLQSTPDHYLAVFGDFWVAEDDLSIQTFSDSDSTQYVDAKGARPDLRMVLEDLYGGEDEIRSAGIFRDTVKAPKQSPHYDEDIKNQYKEAMREQLD